MTTEAVGVSPRIKAGLADVGLALLVPIALMFAVGLFLTDMGADAQYSIRMVSRILPVWLIAYLSTEAVFGWTVGKRFTGLIVRAVDGGPASRRRLLVRWAAKYVWVLIGPIISQLAPAPGSSVTHLAWLLGLGGFLLALRTGHQALWDVLAGTAVYSSRSVPTGSLR